MLFSAFNSKSAPHERRLFFLTSNVNDELRRRIRSICVAVFLILVLLFGICFSILYFSFAGSARKNSLQLVSSTLSAIAKDKDDWFDIEIHDPMSQLLDTRSVALYSLSTEEYPISNSLISKIRSDLYTFKENAAFISSAFIYVHRARSFVSSEYGLSTELQDYYNDIIYNYSLGLISTSIIQSDERTCLVFQWDGDYVVARDLYTSYGERLATIFFVLDTEALVSLLSSSIRISDHFDIYIYDYQFQPVYASTGSSGFIAADQVLRMANSADPYQLIDGRYLIYSSCSKLPVSLILAVDKATAAQALTGQLPVVNILLISILFTITAGVLLVFFALRVARPLSALQNLPFSTDPIKRDLSSWATGILSTAREKLEYADDVAHSISEDVHTRTFSQLFTSQHTNYNEVANILTYVDSPFIGTGLYCSAALRCIKQGELSLAQKRRIMALYKEYAPVLSKRFQCSSHIFPTEGNLFAIVFYNETDITIAEGKQQLKQLTNLIPQAFKQGGYECDISFGHIYHSIMDVGFSYSEALRTLDEMREIPADMDTEVEEIRENTPPTEDITDELIERRAKQIISLAAEYNTERVRSLTERVVDGTLKLSSAAEQRDTLGKLITIMQESMTDYDFINVAQLPDESQSIHAAFENDLNADALKKNVCDAILRMTSAFQDILKNTQNPYIIAAQQYISAHYDDPALSLNDIADAIGITPNYVSGLFSKNLGLTLFEYVNSYRIDRSLERLLDTDETITAISASVGFNTSRSYIRTFKKFKDTTPGEYRKLYRQS